MEIKTQLGKSGRLLLPVKIRKALDLHPGDEIVLRLEEGVFVNRKRAQSRVRIAPTLG